MAKQKSKGRVKRAFASFLGFVMVVGITIAGTLAYLNTVSEERINTFTSTNDIKLYLEEPNYNLKYTYDNDGKITASATKFPAQLDPREYIPGETYPKDPTLYNSTGQQTYKSSNHTNADGTNTELAEEWVAMRVDYSYTKDGTKKKVSRIQLTGDCPTNGNTVKELYSSDSGNEKKYYYGLIDDIVFDVGSYKKGNVNVTGKWIKITKEMCSTEVKSKFETLISDNNTTDDSGDDDPTDNTSEIYVYKYKLKARYDSNLIVNYNNDYYDGLTDDNFKTYQSNTVASVVGTLTEKTTPLFESITIKSQAKLKTNGYEIADLPTFNIDLKGGAIKDMVTITTDEIIDPTTTIASNLSDEEKAALEQKIAGSRKVIDSLVELLAEQ